MREDWIKINLSSVCEILDNLRKPINSRERKKRITGKDISELYPYYGATGQVGYIDDYLTDGDYVLIGEDAAPFLDYTKNVAYKISGKTWVNNHAHILKSNFNDDFLLHYLNQFQYREFVTGTTRLKLTQGALKRIPIKIAPIPIQRAIVKKIETLFSNLDKGIAKLKKAQEQLKIYRQAVLKKAFEGELTKDWREKQVDLPTAEELLEQIKLERQKHYKQQLEDWEIGVKVWEKNVEGGKKPSKPTPLKEFNIDNVSELGSLPNNFIWIPFGNIFADSPQNGLYKPSTAYGSGTCIIRIDNFYEGVLNTIDGFKRVELNLDEIEKYKVENNQILINRVNSIEYLGKTGLVKNLFEPTVFESNIMKISILKEMIMPEYIVHYLTSGIGIKEIRKNAKHAVNQASINQTDVSLTNAPICSTKEQHQIVKEIESRLSVCDKMEESIKEALVKSEALRQSILKKAFEGKLLSEEEIAKCKLEDDYEPAEELLRRIEQSRNEKIKAEKTK